MIKPLNKFEAYLHLKHHMVLISPTLKGYFRAAEILRRDKSKSGCLDFLKASFLYKRRDT